jgi:hypothetical protein
MSVPTLQILTANRLKTGEVLYWKQGAWSERFTEAELFADDEAAKAALAAAQSFVTANQVIGPYLFEVRESKQGLRPIKEREIIRSLGPSVRPDTGKQADPELDHV